MNRAQEKIGIAITRAQVEAWASALNVMVTKNSPVLGVVMEMRAVAADDRPGSQVVMSLDLTRGQIATLDHALRFYASKYQEMVGREKDPYQKQDLQNYIDRADELGRRLRPEIQNAPAKVRS